MTTYRIAFVYPLFLNSFANGKESGGSELYTREVVRRVALHNKITP
jgi:hypothetical protein